MLFRSQERPPCAGVVEQAAHDAAVEARQPVLVPVAVAALHCVLQFVVVGAIVLNTLLAISLWPGREDWRPRPWASTCICVSIGLTYAVVTVSAGPYSTPTSVLLLGLLVIGLLLFDIKPMLAAYTSCVSLLVVHDVGVAMDWWPYAPAFFPALFSEAEPRHLAQGWRLFVISMGYGVILGLMIWLFAGLDALYHQLAALSESDPLTGLCNRRKFMARLEEACARQDRSGVGFSLVLLDADHFKQVNDRYGHQQGDAVLQALGEVLKTAVRAGTDVAARLGGEEFALLLVGATAEEASSVAERVRSMMAQRAFGDQQSPFQVTVSLGCLMCAKTDPSEALREADRLLYAAKSAGRNRIRMRFLELEAKCS